MSEGYEKLKSIGAQKIHETTHITKKYIDAILNEDFEGMHKVQFLGFVSILEREYSVDLTQLKDKASHYFDEHKKDHNSEEDVKVFAQSKKINLTPVYIGLAAVIFISFLFFNKFFENQAPVVVKVDNSTIESAKNNISIKVENNATENNVTDNNETNISVVQGIEVKDIEPEIKNISFKIIPKNRVWLGYIDLETHKKYQKTFSDEFELDPSKDWLFAFGHGYISFKINDEKKEYKIKKNVRFSYIDSELKEITLDEFKSLNKGDRW